MRKIHTGHALRTHINCVMCIYTRSCGSRLYFAEVLFLTPGDNRNTRKIFDTRNYGKGESCEGVGKDWSGTVGVGTAGVDRRVGKDQQRPVVSGKIGKLGTAGSLSQSLGCQYLCLMFCFLQYSSYPMRNFYYNFP